MVLQENKIHLHGETKAYEHITTQIINNQRTFNIKRLIVRYCNLIQKLNLGKLIDKAFVQPSPATYLSC